VLLPISTRLRPRNQTVHFFPGNIFHLWFHPSNFATKTEVQLDVLDKILKYGDRLRQQGKLT
jgi:hypothetical protein